MLRFRKVTSEPQSWKLLLSQQLQIFSGYLYCNFTQRQVGLKKEAFMGQSYDPRLVFFPLY